MFSQTVTYALRALGYIAATGNGNPVLTRTIAEEMGIPRNFLSKIVNRLVHAGLLRSVRGINGGFLLAKDAGDIRFSDVVSLFMNLEDFRVCLFGHHKCNGTCQVHEKWAPVMVQIETFLREMTIDKLAKQKAFTGEF